MDCEVGASVDKKEENLDKWRTSRRQLLKLMAAAGAAAAVAPLAPTFLQGRDNGQPARTSNNLSGTRKRQWAMVIDLRRCDGHVNQDGAPACVEACNREHFVPPGQEWLKVLQMEGPAGHSYFLPRPCMQCENPPCVKVCPVGASYRTEEGIVLVDHEKCIGCRMCMAACPYGVRQFNWDSPPNPPGATFATYSPEYPVPHRRGTVAKCMLCAHRLDDGKLPACVDACPKYALYMGDLVEDTATNGQEVVKLSRFLADNNAFRLKEELGTRPRVWYIPGHGEDAGHTVDQPHQSVERARSWIEQEQASQTGSGGHDGPSP